MSAISLDARIRNGAARMRIPAVPAKRVFAPNHGLSSSAARFGREWLPAPAARSDASTGNAVRRSSWIYVEPQAHTALEKFFLGLCVVAAFIGVAYGFSCLVDLMQNWAAVNAGISKLI